MFKRGMDIFVSASLLLLLSPCFLALAALVRFKLGGRVLFSQIRPGVGSKPFRLIKFRSMKETFDDVGKPLPDEMRLTKFGHFLRSTSLDELPGLWNVLKGEMSLVGPRPLLMEYLPLYTDEQSRRHDVRPGITGWAQINGRNTLSWENKFELDVWYVEHQSLRLDLKILSMTLKKVLYREGIQSENHVTTEAFMGVANKSTGCLSE